MMKYRKTNIPARDQCEYITIRKHLLKTHIKSTHQGIDHPGDQCDFIGVNPSVAYPTYEPRGKTASL